MKPLRAVEILTNATGKSELELRPARRSLERALPAAAVREERGEHERLASAVEDTSRRFEREWVRPSLVDPNNARGLAGLLSSYEGLPLPDGRAIVSKLFWRRRAWRVQ